ncbi:CotO family spore coat protein [Halobacillus naozhouensis]|uniref:CotO family spore coat protein n=1 Tax=Halobacillus naozhouensis TaxID=554880 RepID=A0ABY8J5Z9_9BACI|nr:CotO family spore coat protein [Halobacillus naozhouensis]WFT76190.1 CotO family spore coat protein [Halobacillus naozhouensis]
MASKKKTAKPPVLYITQPHLEPAEISMQTSYHSDAATNQSPTQQQSSDRPPSSQQPRRVSNFENQLRQRSPYRKKVTGNQKDLPKQQDAVQEGQSSDNKENRTKFRDMTIEEKVKYFVNLPAQVPKMKCEVATEEEGQFRGFIEGFNEGIVVMKTLQKPFEKEIKLEDIQSIRLLGF